MLDKDLLKIAIAGFMHDIGKFVQRTGEEIPAYYVNGNQNLYQPFQKNGGFYSHKHALYTAYFIENYKDILPHYLNSRDFGTSDSFINIAASHHKPETLYQHIITTADRLSSGLDRKEFLAKAEKTTYRDYKKVRLSSLFEEINLKNEDNINEPENFVYRLTKIEPDSIFPVEKSEYSIVKEEDAEAEYRQLFYGFREELKRIKNKSPEEFLYFFDDLMMVYTSFIPSAANGETIPDISLYDHSKSTSAIASALYLYFKHEGLLEDEEKGIKTLENSEDKKYLFITGDLYGIQNFIFESGGATNRNSAKLLRGRSFYLSVLAELAAYLICDEIGIPKTNIILNTAAKFVILAPNTRFAREKLKNADTFINEWLFKHSNGGVTIGIVTCEATGEDFEKNYVEIIDSLAQKNEEKKFQRFDILEKGGVISDFLDSFRNDLKHPLCPFCGRRPSSPVVEGEELLRGESACLMCRDQVFLGSNIVKNKRMYVLKRVKGELKKEEEVKNRKHKTLLPIYNRFYLGFKKIKGFDTYCSWQIEPEPENLFQDDSLIKMINGHVPQFTGEEDQEKLLERFMAGEKSDETKEQLLFMFKERGVKSFLHIAKYSLNETEDKNGKLKFSGLEALGVLKADVDNLGLIFSTGFKKEYTSISRIVSLSRMLNNFFAFYLPYFLKTEEKYQNIYTVFSGGDDLFLIGPWNVMIDFASHLNKRFKEYTCFNSDINFSAAITLHKPSEPVRKFAEKSEEELSKSKTKKPAITVFGETVSWEEFNYVFVHSEEFKNVFLKAGEKSSFLYRLNDILEMAIKEVEIRQKIKSNALFSFTLDEFEPLKWRSYLSYWIARNIKGDEAEEVKSKVYQFLEAHREVFKIVLWSFIYNRRGGSR